MFMQIDFKYNDDFIESAVLRIAERLNYDYGMSNRSIALLLLQGDNELISLVEEKEAKASEIKKIITAVASHYPDPIHYVVASRRQELASRIAKDAFKSNHDILFSWPEFLSRLMIRPITGVPILLLVLYYGLYKFVGEFGAGVCVNYIESHIFDLHIIPWLVNLFNHYLPWPIVGSLFVGEYGIITLGLRYAVAIILPVVGTFFIAFAIIEDTGYLPRLALLIDRIFKKIGLSGRAVIPMVLGLGCATMATMVTRTLPTKRERVIATILLALAVPCSAQLGVILSLLEGSRMGLFIWAFVVLLVFLLIGFLSAQLMPGERPSFYMEIPTLRLPKISNVLIKTWSRLVWYFAEIFPMFIGASLIIWVGQITGVFGVCVKIMEYPIRWIGLPDQAAVSFLFGFFRRDYGAAGLYDLKSAGLLNGNQLVVACITLTLFLPCIAQLLMNIKERGIKLGVVISLFILVFSFSAGFVVNLVLNIFNIHL